MKNFEFSNKTTIIFGKGTETLVGEKTAEYSKRILLHYGMASIKKSGLYDTVVKSLKASGVDFVELPGVLPNPHLSLVYEGIKLVKEQKLEFILAVGGGSVIDSAKTIATGACTDRNVWDFFEKKAVIEDALPLGTVLTIPASGSEMSNSAVITNTDNGHKWDIGATCLRPRFSILNPELTYTLDAYQTACGVTDMMVHILERYFTNETDVDLTDRLCEATLKSIICNAPIVLKEPTNYAARAEIMWAGTIAHNDLIGTGRVGDWSSHRMEHELSADYDVAHGAGLAIIVPAWMKYVYKHNLERFVQYAVRVWGVDMQFSAPEQIALEGIARTERFFSSIGMPVTMKQMGVTDDSNLEPMAKKVIVRGSFGQIRHLEQADAYNIYKLAFGE